MFSGAIFFQIRYIMKFTAIQTLYFKVEKWTLYWLTAGNFSNLFLMDQLTDSHTIFLVRSYKLFPSLVNKNSDLFISTDIQARYHSQHHAFRLSCHQFSMIRNGYHSNFNQLIWESIQTWFLCPLSAVHKSFVDLVVEKVVSCFSTCFSNKGLWIEVKDGSIIDTR